MDRQSTSKDLQQVSEELARDIIYGEFTTKLMKGELQYHAWPRTYGSTAGPFSKPGMLAGAACTTFTIECWSNGRFTVEFCKGKILRVVETPNGFEIGR